MDGEIRRRRFLQSASAMGLGAGLGAWSSLGPITPAHASELVVGPEAVRFRPEVEPVVRWIEETPRDEAFGRAVRELKSGLSYRDLLAGLFLAGIRNIKPRPVGFKFHAVLVMNSAHLLAQSASADERLLPMFWALDNFKGSQAQDVKEGDWTLGKLDESKLPKPTQARAAFTRAMDAWDAEAADLAIAALCRSAGAGETIEALWHYAVRDQRNIGHKPIFVAQSRRTLQAIGWQHAEPVLRSVVFGILDLRGGFARPVPVGPLRGKPRSSAKTLREGWSVGKGRPRGDPASLLEAIRHVEPAEPASAEAATLINRGGSRRHRSGTPSSSPASEMLHAEPRHHRPARDDFGQRAALHLSTKPPTTPSASWLCSRPWAGCRSIGIGSSRSRTSRLTPWSRPRSTAKGDEALASRSSRRPPREGSGRRGFVKRSGLLQIGRLARTALRHGPADDPAQGAGQPRLQVWRGGLGRGPARGRSEVARRPRRRFALRTPRREHAREPADEAGARSDRGRDGLIPSQARGAASDLLPPQPHQIFVGGDRHPVASLILGVAVMPEDDVDLDLMRGKKDVDLLP